MKRMTTILLMALVALATRGSAASAAGYRVTDLGIISGAYECFPRGMNDNGWVVGSSDQRRIAHYKGWLWVPTTPNASTGSVRALEPLGGLTYIWATDVNNSGFCVGYSYGGSISEVATYWRGPDYAPVNFNSLPRNPADPSVANWQFLIPASVSEPADGTRSPSGRSRRAEARQPTTSSKPERASICHSTWIRRCSARTG